MKTRVQTLRHVLTALVIGVSFGCQAAAPIESPPSRELQHRIDTAHSRSDHETLAAYYVKQAASARRQMAEHLRLAKRYEFAGVPALMMLVVMSASAADVANEVVVYKSPYCGCCGAWIEHMRAAGFSVKVTAVNDTTAARKRLGLPDQYGSCHTATVAGYVLEGHVPATEVKRLLVTRPKALGLAVPGMPPSSPGMDVPGRKDPYHVLLVDVAGQASVFARHPK